MQKILNRLAVFVSKPEHLKDVDRVVSNYTEYHDVFLISDADISSSYYAVLLPFYVKFSDIDIVFMDLSDYFSHRDDFASKKIGVVTTLTELLDKNIDPKKSKIYKVIEL